MPSPDPSALNDKVNGPHDLAMDVQNRAFRYGDGLFETMLLRGEQVVHIDFHLARMCNGMQILGFSFIEKDWKRLVLERIAALCRGADAAGFARLRVQVVRQGGGAYLPETDLPRLFAEMHPLAGDPWVHAAPLRVGVYADLPLHANLLSQVKSLNALPYILAAKHAQAQGWDDSLLLAADGGLAESSRANLFLVRDGALFTPPLASGCLPGTMRAAVIRAAQAAGIPLREQRIVQKDIGLADEVFLTNAIRGLQPVGEWGNFSAKQDGMRKLLLAEVLRQSKNDPPQVSQLKVGSRPKEGSRVPPEEGNHEQN